MAAPLTYLQEREKEREPEWKTEREMKYPI